MITTQVSWVMNEIYRAAFDLDMARWPNYAILDFINRGQLEAVTLNPAVNPVEGPVLLSSGLSQQLPSGGIRLLSIKWNMDPTGTYPATQIVPTTRLAIAKRIPTWTTDAANPTVACYIYEPQNNLSEFDVYPAQPLTDQGYVWMVYSAIPTRITDSNPGTLITIKDYWRNALVSYGLYRCYDEDSENSNVEKRNHYYSLFLTQLGLVAPAGTQTAQGQ